MLNPFPPLAHARPGRVLVVDDDEKNRSLVRDILEAGKFVVDEAVDGEQALNRIALQEPDVVVLDIMMPRMDGFEVCRRLKQAVATVHIPIIIVTSLTDREDRIKGIEAGANEFITKPIDGHEVLLRVRNAVYGKHLFDELQRNYKVLRDMEELRDHLRDLIASDTETLSGLLSYVRTLDPGGAAAPRDARKD